MIIDAPTAKVREALTRPEMIKQYLFGTEVTTDWRMGGYITFRGEWNGNRYEDKGKILQIEPEELLVSTFRSSLSGLPDAPENYKSVRYKLRAEGEGTKLILAQDNNDNQETADHSEQNWKIVLGKLKALMER